MENHVKELIVKAAAASAANEALMFSQAACNAANAIRALADAKTTTK